MSTWRGYVGPPLAILLFLVWIFSGFIYEYFDEDCDCKCPTIELTEKNNE
jgi:hypothetical protein